jgi:WhiB family redox-sensing transcriptional regulator
MLRGFMRDDDLVLFNTPPPGAWADVGECARMGVELFFPKAGSRPSQALLMCAVCSVRRECAEYALEHNQHWGVWGGLTERQRFAVKKARREGVVHPLDPVRFGDVL